MPKIIAWLRFIAIIISVAIMALVVLLIFPFSKSFVRQQIRMIWTRCLLASAGAKININGYKLKRRELVNSMIVSNHISWLDPVVMLHLCFVQYIGKIEMQNWPILNRIIAAGGTIFIDRSLKKDILTVNQQVATLLQNGTTIGLFPEGKTSIGLEVLPFKASILEAALIAKSKIFPVVFNYRKEKNLLAKEVSFAEVNLFTSVMNTLSLKKLTINITVLPPVYATDFENRELLNKHLHQLISNCYTQTDSKQ